MKSFTIEIETNHITPHATAQEAKSARGAERFASASALAGLAAHWPPARLVGIWNNLPGATPVKRFKDRATAVSRIWNAIQILGDAVPSTPGVASGDLPSKARVSRAGEPPVAATKKGFREGSKTQTILGLLNRPGGVALQQIMQATHWQAHSVRGFLSGGREDEADRATRRVGARYRNGEGWDRSRFHRPESAYRISRRT